MICENCGNEHDGSYGSGRFCSAHCRRVWTGKRSFEKRRAAGTFKTYFSNPNFKHKHKAVYGTWKCIYCEDQPIFETRAMLKQHFFDKHQHLISIDNICPYCGRKFENGQELGGHISHCKMHPLKKQHDLAHKQAGKTLREKIAAGVIIPSQTGKPLSIETRQKISDSRIKTLDSNLKCGRRLDVKWYKVKNLNGIEYTVRGHWEEKVALELNRRGILWERNKAVKYKKDILRNYVPDFYLPQFNNTFLEVKGYFPQEDYKKMKLALEYNPTMKLFLIGEDKYQDFINGKIDLQNCSFA